MKKNLGTVIVDEETSDEQMVLCKHTEWVWVVPVVLLKSSGHYSLVNDIFILRLSPRWLEDISDNDATIMQGESGKEHVM